MSKDNPKSSTDHQNNTDISLNQLHQLDLLLSVIPTSGCSSNIASLPPSGTTQTCKCGLKCNVVSYRKHYDDLYRILYPRNGGRGESDASKHLSASCAQLPLSRSDSASQAHDVSVFPDGLPRAFTVSTSSVRSKRSPITLCGPAPKRTRLAISSSRSSVAATCPCLQTQTGRVDSISTNQDAFSNCMDHYHHIKRNLEIERIRAGLFVPIDRHTDNNYGSARIDESQDLQPNVRMSQQHLRRNPTQK